MSDTGPPGGEHDDGHAEHCDVAQPEHQSHCESTPDDQVPSTTDLDEREANRSSQRKAAGPGARRGTGRSASPGPAASTAGAISDPSAENTGDGVDDGTERRRAPETRLEP